MPDPFSVRIFEEPLSDYLRPFPPWRGQQFILTKIDMFSKCAFTFPACYQLGQRLYSRTHRVSDLLTWDLPHTGTSDQRARFMKKMRFCSGYMSLWFTDPTTSHIIAKLLAWKSNGMASKKHSRSNSLKVMSYKGIPSGYSVCIY